MPVPTSVYQHVNSTLVITETAITRYRSSLIHTINEANTYIPSSNRENEHPTTDIDTLIHFLKTCLGSGILAMPMAYTNVGIYFGVFATIFVGCVTSYCVHILIKCAQILCRRAQVPALTYPDVAETALSLGPPALRKYALIFRRMIAIFLILNLLGCCCVYNIFVASNIKQVVEHYFYNIQMNIRLYILMILPALIPINLIRNLKFLMPVSFIANILIIYGLIITMYYVFTDLPPLSSRPAIQSVTNWPFFFGIAIFSLEGIGLMLPLENNMENPDHFTGCPSVLSTGMMVVIFLFTSVGFLGYWRFGDDTEGSITLNLPVHEGLAQSVKLAFAIAIFFSYALLFHVPIEMIWVNIKDNFKNHSILAEYFLRIILVIATIFIAMAIPELGPAISLIGAVCLSTLGLMFPSIIEIVTYMEYPGFGKMNWILWKNIILIMFGFIGFFSGTYLTLYTYFK